LKEQINKERVKNRKYKEQYNHLCAKNEEYKVLIQKFADKKDIEVQRPQPINENI
jgi:hypothetical protein